jgi:hypothetical protein
MVDMMIDTHISVIDQCSIANRTAPVCLSKLRVDTLQGVDTRGFYSEMRFR